MSGSRNNERVVNSRELARRLSHYIRPYYKVMFLALVMILAVTFTINYLPIIIRNATDIYLSTKGQALSDSARLFGLCKVGAIYISLASLGFLMRYGQGLLISWVGQQIIRDLRNDVFQKALGLEFAFYDHTPVGRMITRITSDVERMQRFVTDGVVGTVADSFMLLGIVGYMVYMSPLLAGALFLILPLIFGGLFLVNRQLRKAHRRIRHSQSRLNTLIQEYIGGMGTIQLFNREQTALHDFDGCNSQMRAAHFNEVHWFSLYFPILEVGQALSLMVVFGVGGLALLEGSTLVSIGTFVAFVAYIREFFRPLGSLSNKANIFQEAMASAERIFSLMDLSDQIPEPSNPLSEDAIQGEIEFRDVSFAYEKENWVLQDLNFQVKSGESVAVVGATGAGKTTIKNLLGRFYDVQKGSISFGGHDLSEFRKSALRKKIGFVFQEPFIFSGSVADNIAMHDPDLDRAEIEAAARAVNADGLISKMSAGYDTLLGERGGGLSLGEKQLIAMARVFVQRPEMLIVLDEATASVDSATELLVQDALRTLERGRTSIVIAHRLSTIRHADRIIVLRQGRLVAQGTHEELLAEKGYYYKLYQLLSHHLN